MNIDEETNYCLNCNNKPCSAEGCPLNNDIPGFIKKIKEKEYEEAFRILEKTTVLSAVCGRICPHYSQCQGKCIRGIKGNPVNIGRLEAFIGDMAIDKKWQFKKNQEDKNKKISVIGGGPAGLTAAAFLRKKGYEVTIFEKYNKLGGLLVHGIPEFRLDRKNVEKNINHILNLGISVKYNKELGVNLDLDTLKKEYDAILLSFGANISTKMNVEGEDLEGVYGANELLEFENHPDYKDKIVAVNGGGNTAMDISRTVKRLGAKKVYIIYRRAREQMPAENEEIESAINDGVEILYQNNIVKIKGNTKVENIECIKTELVEIEGENRLKPKNIEGSNYDIPVDFVITAIGSKPDRNILDSLNIELDSKGYINKKNNNQTSDDKIFCAGDVCGIKNTIAWAAKSGRDAAENIDKFLNKK